MINQLYGSADRNNDFSQWETDDSATYQVYSYVPEEKEAGYLEIKMNCVNTSTGAQAVRKRSVRYKMVNGVASIAGSQQDYTNSDSGMAGSDFTATASGSQIIVSIVGMAGVRHDLHIYKQNSRLKY
jgi:hypothetical protein